MTTHTTFHWYFDEEARLREELLLARLEQSRLRWITRGQRRLVRVLMALALVVVVVSLGREYLVWEEMRMRGIISQSVEVEAWAWHRLDYAAVTASLDPEAREDWVRWHNQYQQGRRNWAGRDARLPQVEIGGVEFLGRGRALVEVWLRAAEVPDVEQYREYRLYRNLAGEWLRTSTDVDLWGAPTERSAGVFHFVYSAQDAQAVERVAAEVETLWQNLCQRLGLNPTPEDPSLRIVIQGENVGVGPLRFDGDRLLLLSPRLARAPVYEDEAQTLSRMIATALTRRAMDRFMQGRGFDPRWAVTYEAALVWLAEDANPLLPRNPRQESGSLRKRVAQFGLPRLDDLLEKRTANYFWWSGWVSTAGHSLVTYEMNTYGADRFDDLLVGLAVAEDWEELSQSVFGVSAAELERGWQRYLHWRYQLE
ncbi:MAG: hypothetical protein HY328_09200 [Chloroflexi bacterium]|nr:hypothetical protein [Chloroflexota bacterium]